MMIIARRRPGTGHPAAARPGHQWRAAAALPRPPAPEPPPAPNGGAAYADWRTEVVGQIRPRHWDR